MKRKMSIGWKYKHEGQRPREIYKVAPSNRHRVEPLYRHFPWEPKSMRIAAQSVHTVRDPQYNRPSRDD